MYNFKGEEMALDFFFFSKKIQAAFLAAVDLELLARQRFMDHVLSLYYSLRSAEGAECVTCFHLKA